MHGGTDYHALRDIDDAREINAFEDILKKCCHPGLESCKWKKKSDIDDEREISALLTSFKEKHTVVIGNTHQINTFFTMLPKCDCNIPGDACVSAIWKKILKIEIYIGSNFCSYFPFHSIKSLTVCVCLCVCLFVCSE